MTPKDRVPRKKSCHVCSQSKVRCDLRRPSCSRCKARSLDCTYTGDFKTRKDNAAEPVTHDDLVAEKVVGAGLPPSEQLDFSNIHLICTVDAHRIRVRWLESLLPSTDQRVKPYQPATMAFVASIFKSYPESFVNGDCPPFIHWSQLDGEVPRQLAICMNIASLWASRTTQTVNMVRGVIAQEMADLLEEGPCGHLEHLAILQSYLLYAMMLFSAGPLPNPEPDVMIKLQNLAGDVARRGTLCSAESEGLRPHWESWIVASAKRRTLFTISLFDNLVNFTLGSPSFVAVELAGLPAPSSKHLWTARHRPAWKQAYNHQLHHGDGELLISDLWPQSKENQEALQPRITRWLSLVDEFGMMLYAVTFHTYNDDTSQQQSENTST